MSVGKSVRIGGGGAGYGDGAMASPVLIRSGDIDYLMLDFLSEYYMPMAARAWQADPSAGFVHYFPGEFYPAIAADLAERKVKLITNAGAVNPRACAAALQAEAAKLGLSPRIAVVDGDNLLQHASALKGEGRLTQPLPEGGDYTGIHAYLGAFPIARALDLGADIVITGRVVDSALALGPLIHEFGWRADDYDLIAAGSLIGHILECGAQATGGLFTDWREIVDYSDIGYPIAEVKADGSAVISKVDSAGGLVTVGTVAEQLVYEIDDPSTYRLPDVTVDFSEVRFEQVGKDQVLVTGAKGRAPGPDYKGIATWDDGVFGALGFYIRGPDAAAKARANAESIVKRAGRMLLERNMAPMRRSRIEVIGEEESYGAHARPQRSREVFCRIALDVEDAATYALIFRESNTGMTSMTPGMTASMMMAGPFPMAHMEAFMIPAREVPALVTIDGKTEAVERFAHTAAAMGPEPAAVPTPPTQPDTTVPLSALAWVRSGDKGHACNVGVVARKAEYLPYIAAVMTADAMVDHYAFWFQGDRKVERHYLPGSNALNFVLRGGLDGGCTVSLRFDPMGKSAAQDVLDLPIAVPTSILAEA